MSTSATGDSPEFDPASVPVKDAATLLLVRDSREGPEVFAIRRARSMVFASGMIAFPGGGVDPTDCEAFPTTGPSAEQWSARLGVAPERALSLCSAAIRECFEETGLLLASPQCSIASDGALPDSPWPGRRTRVAAHETSLAALLSEAGIAADTALLHPLGRWVTPVGPPRRYDTFFFGVEIAQDGPHQPDGDNGEFEGARWARPAALLEAFRNEEIALLPPTVHHLSLLAEASSAADFLEVDRDMTPVRIDKPATFSRKLNQS
ncbi:NUDIX hydrolase [Dietzia sp.]|uniref:NUDIX hydrolase n=1 Tax=Dietzia sp. TaxID=1871616 RepID=UPI002FDB4583